MSTLIEKMTSAGVRDPEVSEKAKRRRFSAEYKLRIVREADACKGDGDVAALLRREGLYSSHLSSWRRQRDEITKAGLTSRKRGRKAKAEAPRIKELERENARLQRRLARVETMLEIQKKASELLGILSFIIIDPAGMVPLVALRRTKKPGSARAGTCRDHAINGPRSWTTQSRGTPAIDAQRLNWLRRRRAIRSGGGAHPLAATRRLLRSVMVGA